MISLISTIASLIGAYIAIWQAKKARDSASFVKKIKKQIG